MFSIVHIVPLSSLSFNIFSLLFYPHTTVMPCGACFVIRTLSDPVMPFFFSLQPLSYPFIRCTSDCPFAPNMYTKNHVVAHIYTHCSLTVMLTSHTYHTHITHISHMRTTHTMIIVYILQPRTRTQHLHRTFCSALHTHIYIAHSL